MKPHPPVVFVLLAALTGKQLAKLQEVWGPHRQKGSDGSPGSSEPHAAQASAGMPTRCLGLRGSPGKVGARRYLPPLLGCGAGGHGTELGGLEHRAPLGGEGRARAADWTLSGWKGGELERGGGWGQGPKLS